MNTTNDQNRSNESHEGQLLSEKQRAALMQHYTPFTKRSYLPEVLLFIPIPVEMLLILISNKIGIPRSMVSLIWLTLFSNAFIFLFVFFRILVEPKSTKRTLYPSCRVIVMEGILTTSSISSVASSLLYLISENGKVPLYRLENIALSFNTWGEALCVEEVPGELRLVHFEEKGVPESVHPRID